MQMDMDMDNGDQIEMEMDMQMEMEMEMEQYGCDDDYMNQLMSFQRRNSSVQNMQYQMGELANRIMGEVAKISQESMMGADWSLLAYSACGWRKDLWETLFLAQKHKAFIHYTDKYVNCQGEIGKG